MEIILGVLFAVLFLITLRAIRHYENENKY